MALHIPALTGVGAILSLVPREFTRYPQDLHPQRLENRLETNLRFEESGSQRRPPGPCRWRGAGRGLLFAS